MLSDLPLSVLANDGNRVEGDMISVDGMFSDELRATIDINTSDSHSARLLES